MASTKSTATVLVIIGVLFLCGIGFVVFKVRRHIQEKRTLAALKAEKPVEYYVLHTAKTQSDDELKNEMVGTWELAGARVRSTGNFIFVPAHSGYFKMWTLTNWAIVTYDAQSNVLYTASGHYTVQGDLYMESIEAATGSMTRYLGAHPAFKIRVDGDNYYQMTAGKTASPLEEMWHRVE